MSRQALECYETPERFAKDGRFVVNPLHLLGESQVNAIRKFLNNEVWLKVKAEGNLQVNK